MDNLVLLDMEKLKPLTQGVAAAGVVIDNEVKWKVGEAEFESFMRMLDNLVSELRPATFYPSAFKLPAPGGSLWKCLIRGDNEKEFLIQLEEIRLFSDCSLCLTFSPYIICYNYCIQSNGDLLAANRLSATIVQHPCYSNRTDNDESCSVDRDVTLSL